MCLHSHARQQQHPGHAGSCSWHACVPSLLLLARLKRRTLYDLRSIMHGNNSRLATWQTCCTASCITSITGAPDSCLCCSSSSQEKGQGEAGGAGQVGGWLHILGTSRYWVAVELCNDAGSLNKSKRLYGLCTSVCCRLRTSGRSTSAT